MKNYGKVSVESAANAEKFAAMIGALNLKPPILIKPNWGTVECYSEADILDWTLTAIPGDKIVIESHGWARDEETLQHKKTARLTKAHLRKSDRWFQEYAGIDKVLEKHHVEYVNLTEEVWAGRIADPSRIQQAVEENYSPVQFEELYSRVPQRLFEMRGGSLLSLAKYKVMFYPLGVSFSIKNLFGLIPGPSRGKFHGTEHAYLDQSIVDINKIYRSLFSVKGVIEAVHSAVYWETEEEGARIDPGCGMVFASEDTVSLDAFAAIISGRDPDSVGHLRLAAQTFGAWDLQAYTEAAQSGIKVLEL